MFHLDEPRQALVDFEPETFRSVHGVLRSVEHLARLGVASKASIEEHPAEGTQPVERSFFF